MEHGRYLSARLKEIHNVREIVARIPPPVMIPQSRRLSCVRPPVFRQRRWAGDWGASCPFLGTEEKKSGVPALAAAAAPSGPGDLRHATGAVKDMGPIKDAVAVGAAGFFFCVFGIRSLPCKYFCEHFVTCLNENLGENSADKKSHCPGTDPDQHCLPAAPLLEQDHQRGDTGHEKGDDYE